MQYCHTCMVAVNTVCIILYIAKTLVQNPFGRSFVQSAPTSDPRGSLHGMRLSYDLQKLYE